MKLVRFLHRDIPRFGRLANDQIEMISGDPFNSIKPGAVSMNLDKVQLLAPVAPSKIVAVGLNYRDHAKELGMELPKEPVIFLKPPSSVIGSNESIAYPPESKHVEYEAELAIVIGKTASHISVDAAQKHILGYTCANDITARDLQKRDGQWARAKGFDTFCPLGPHIETDFDPENVGISLRQNGVVKQESSTASMVYNVFELVCFISGAMTLFPGDVVLTGTPPGVGPVKIGDLVEVSIDGIGSLTNKII